jgi:transglutaminase/protease-like cytokinesis protein 3
VKSFIRILAIVVFSVPGVSTSMQAQDASANRADYERLKKHVEKTPRKITNDPKALVKYLTKKANSKKESVQLFYYWIAANIAYDVESYDNGTIKHQSELETLKRKKAVCSGYAGLFKMLCDLAKIKCVVISGYSKGYDYSVTGKRPEKTNHAWNAVFIDNKWRLIDVTWGAGFVRMQGDKLIFVKSLDLGYLFCDSKEFIKRHLPEDPKWQLLNHVVSIDEFYGEAAACTVN